MALLWKREYLGRSITILVDQCMLHIDSIDDDSQHRLEMCGFHSLCNTSSLYILSWPVRSRWTDSRHIPEPREGCFFRARRKRDRKPSAPHIVERDWARAFLFSHSVSGIYRWLESRYFDRSSFFDV
jgi:hypothetical protein